MGLSKGLTKGLRRINLAHHHHRNHANNFDIIINFQYKL